MKLLLLGSGGREHALAWKSHKVRKLKTINLIDPKVYREEKNSLLAKENHLKKELERLDEGEAGQNSTIQATRVLINLLEKKPAFDKFDETVFDLVVQKVVVLDRDHVQFVLKCGLRLAEPL